MFYKNGQHSWIWVGKTFIRLELWKTTDFLLLKTLKFFWKWIYECSGFFRISEILHLLWNLENRLYKKSKNSLFLISEKWRRKVVNNTVKTGTKDQVKLSENRFLRWVGSTFWRRKEEEDLNWRYFWKILCFPFYWKTTKNIEEEKSQWRWFLPFYVLWYFCVFCGWGKGK